MTLQTVKTFDFSDIGYRQVIYDTKDGYTMELRIYKTQTAVHIFKSSSFHLVTEHISTQKQVSDFDKVKKALITLGKDGYMTITNWNMIMIHEVEDVSILYHGPCNIFTLVSQLNSVSGGDKTLTLYIENVLIERLDSLLK